MYNLDLFGDISEIGGQQFYDFLFNVRESNLEYKNIFTEIYKRNFNFGQFTTFFENFNRNIEYSNEYCIDLLYNIFYELKNFLIFKNNIFPKIEVNIYENKLVFLFDEINNYFSFIQNIENFINDFSESNMMNLKEFVLIGFKNSRIGINNTLSFIHCFDMELFDFFKNIKYDENKSICKSELLIRYNKQGNEKIKYYFRFLDYEFESDDLQNLKDEVREVILIENKDIGNNFFNILFEGFDYANDEFFNELNDVKYDIWQW